MPWITGRAMPNVGGGKPIQSVAQGQPAMSMQGPQVRQMSLDSLGVAGGSMRVPLSMLAGKPNHNFRKRETRKARASEARAQDEDDYLAMGLEYPTSSDEGREVVVEHEPHEDEVMATGLECPGYVPE